MVSVHKSPPPTAPPAFDQPPTETYSQTPTPPPPPPPRPPATGIPVHVQPSSIQNNIGGNNWSSGLCDCFSDCSLCCMTCCCPCITFGQIAEIVDRGSSSCIANGALYCLLQHVSGCACLYSCFYRSKLRKQYDLKEGPCGDCLVHFCCECCALCQESRELKRRGFDLSIGWQGNIEKQNQGTTPPFSQQGMYR